MTTPYFMIQRTPESLGFKVGTVHMLKWMDRSMNLLIDVGHVEVIEVADNFLLSVKPLAPMDDRECGDHYQVGQRFTAWRGGDHDNPYLTFIPCPDEDEPGAIECPVCGEVVSEDEYSFTDGVCWECQEDDDE